MTTSTNAEACPITLVATIGLLHSVRKKTRCSGTRSLDTPPPHRQIYFFKILILILFIYFNMRSVDGDSRTTRRSNHRRMCENYWAVRYMERPYTASIEWFRMSARLSRGSFFNLTAIHIVKHPRVRLCHIFSAGNHDPSVPSRDGFGRFGRICILGRGRRRKREKKKEKQNVRCCVSLIY